MSINTFKQTKINKEQLTSLYYLMQNNNDQHNADKLLDLYEKYQSEEFVIGFSGHFSAGKSSMINYLLNEDLLPKSPIPTSANIVKISSGKDQARIYFHNNDYIIYEAPYDIDVIKEFCKDKDTIEKIELSTTNRCIPENCSLVDTPGIDAADDTDRLITESSLHTIDYMVYIVDYNHIQSEVNLKFLQKLQHMKIPFDLVINQIDKHNEHEITFETFEKEVKQTFDQWSINPCHIYFTSLKNINLKLNQVDSLQKDIFTKFDKKISNITNSLQFILNEHRLFLKQLGDEKLANLGFVSDFNESNLQCVQELEESIESLKKKPDYIFKRFNESINQTLNNAYLMPAQLRDIGRSFLISREKGFKVGLINSKKKTSDEQKKRSDYFLAQLLKSIEASLKWKLRDKLHQLVKEFKVEDQELNRQIQHLDINYSTSDLIKLTNEGAKVNGDYVLNYINDVSHDIKNKYKQQLNPIAENVQRIVREQSNSKLKQLENEYKILNAKVDKYHQARHIEDITSDKISRLYETIESAHASTQEITSLAIKINTKYNYVKQSNEAIKPSKESKYEIIENDNSGGTQTNGKLSVARIFQAIDKTIHAIEKLPGFSSMITELESKQQRLTEREFTIALFGAFSAGKSSFANALIGERLLPTSPNPTTAVINKLAPPDENNINEAVKIQFKNNDTLTSDLYAMVKNIAKDSEINDFHHYHDILEWIKDNQIQYNRHLDKTHQSFLQSMIQGYEVNKDRVNQQLNVSLEHFENYIVDETIACYIEEVTLYYDCSITRKGITLVDTPGADSINARHTNVAFDYIKNADAILYVTYYNHALSGSDKNFLLQLGRVKDSFELDKMYFIINAIDLAVDEKEINLVSRYVKEQLLELGIRSPKIYPLSSKEAIEDLSKGYVNPYLTQFQNDLFHFIEYDLSEVIIKSSVVDIERVKQTLGNHLNTLQLKKSELDQTRTNLLNAQEKAKNIIHGISNEVYGDRLKQRIKKQVYFVEERLSIRFHDMFKEKFNPTTVTESGRKAMQELEYNIKGLIDYVGYELLQEVRAVSLRIEAFIRTLLTEESNSITEQLKAIESQFTTSLIGDVSLDTPHFEQPLTNIKDSYLKEPLNLFKGTKSFFVKNEKEQMKEAIYELLTPYIQLFIADMTNLMVETYHLQWGNLVNDRKKQMELEIDEYVESSIQIMASSAHLEDIKSTYSKLEKIIDHTLKG